MKASEKKQNFISDINDIRNLDLKCDWGLYHELIVKTVEHYGYNFVNDSTEEESTEHLNCVSKSENIVFQWIETQIKEFAKEIEEQEYEYSESFMDDDSC